MFGKIYALPIATMIFLAAAGTALWILSGLLQENRITKMVKTVILILVTFFILQSTLFGRETYEEQRLSLEPFASFEAAKIQPEVYRSVLLNFLMFLPFGLSIAWLLPARWKTMWRALLVILPGLIFSLTIEMLQYYLCLGIAETDDVIFNTLGCVFAAGVIPLRDRVIRTGQNRHRNSI